MTEDKTELHKRVESGEKLLIAEFTPPAGVDPEAIRAAAKRYAGKIHALGVSDNRDRVGMSALAAAAFGARAAGYRLAGSPLAERYAALAGVALRGDLAIPAGTSGGRRVAVLAGSVRLGVPDD